MLAVQRHWFLAEPVERRTVRKTVIALRIDGSPPHCAQVSGRHRDQVALPILVNRPRAGLKTSHRDSGSPLRIVWQIKNLD